MKRAISFFLSLALLFALLSVVGCHDEKTEAELQSQINSAKSDLAQVRAANEAVMRVGDSLNTQLNVAQTANDSLTQANQKTAGRLASTQSDLKKERKKVDSLKLVVTEMEPAVRELPIVKQQLADEQTARVAVEAERDAVKGVAAELSSLITDRYNPWCRKWKHDATERNFLEKIFGADKAPTPGVPEPDIQ